MPGSAKLNKLHLQFSFDDMMCLGSAVVDHYDDITSAEKKVVDNAVEKRQREFSTGRWLARHALAVVGIERFDLLPGLGRQPIWPNNIVGSITHTEKYAAVAVTTNAYYRGLGIDLESTERLERDLIPKVLLPSEQEYYKDIDATLIFSAKESCYKLLYPLIGEFVDFLDIEIHLNEVQNTFKACYQGRHQAHRIIDHALGQYLMFNDHWLTCIALRTAPST